MTDRVRCPECGQFPTLTTEGQLRNHSYPWAHPQHGHTCLGSGTQILPLPGQTTLEELDEATTTPQLDDA